MNSDIRNPKVKIRNNKKKTVSKNYYFIELA